jgi:putative oxidoreductase
LEEQEMTTTASLSKIVFVASRFIVGGMYLGAGIENLFQLDSRVGYAAFKGLTNATFWVTVASLLLVLGGTSLITGIKPRLGVAAIALFLVPVTLIMHNFWALEGMQAEIERHTFMGNVGLFGSALLILAIPQPWAFTLENVARSVVLALRNGHAKATVQQGDLQEAYLAK